jgi:enamine deaminase RidA (YjgF/YER057c/UK114 family)
VDAAVLTRGDICEASITVHVDGAPDLAALLREAQEEATALGMTVLRQDVFGTPAQHDSAPRMLREICGDVDWPVTWLEEGDSLGERLTGTHLYAVRGAPVRRLEHAGEVVGSVFSDGTADYCHIGSIVSRDLSAGRMEQARDVLERIEAVARLAGMDFSHVVRTWFYNDRILDWYADFNTVRTQFFEERGVFDGLVPASTGIGGGNRCGAALVAEALLVRPLDPSSGVPRVKEVPSPLQCPATAYRSSFSRAVEVVHPGLRRLYVSGTASIDPAGGTAHVGSVKGQTELTLDVIEGILESRGMGWPDVTRAIAYVKSGADAARYHETLRRRGMAPLPAVVTENDVCRDDLLFELEVDAVTTVER